MEDKTRQKEKQFRLRVRLQREKLEFRKEQFYLKEKNASLRPTLRQLQRGRRRRKRPPGRLTAQQCLSFFS